MVKIGDKVFIFKDSRISAGHIVSINKTYRCNIETGDIEEELCWASLDSGDLVDFGGETPVFDTKEGLLEHLQETLKE